MSSPGESATLADAWFARRGWQPFPFQREVWAAMAAGDSWLLHATTGLGKTYAVGFGALARENARDELAAVRTVIVDEWHELMGN